MAAIQDWTIARICRTNDDAVAQGLDADLETVCEAVERTPLGQAVIELQSTDRAGRFYRLYLAGFQALKKQWRAGAGPGEERWEPFERVLVLAEDAPERFEVPTDFFDPASSPIALDRSLMETTKPSDLAVHAVARRLGTGRTTVRELRQDDLHVRKLAKAWPTTPLGRMGMPFTVAEIRLKRTRRVRGGPLLHADPDSDP